MQDIPAHPSYDQDTLTPFTSAYDLPVTTSFPGPPRPQARVKVLGTRLLPLGDFCKATTPTSTQLCSNTYTSRSERKSYTE